LFNYFKQIERQINRAARHPTEKAFGDDAPEHA
jgi:hypothetical protein